MLEFVFGLGQTVATDYYYNTRLVALMQGQTLTGYRLELPDGRQFLYEHEWESQYLYMTEATDAEGFITHFNYLETYDNYSQPALRLLNVTDHVGSTLYTFEYNQSYPSNANLVSKVNDRFGRSVQLTYSDVGYSTVHLTQIRDAAYLTSSVAYSTEGWAETLTTPYGTTSFAYQWSQSGYGALRRVDITEPNAGKQIYVFGGDWSAWGLPITLPTNLKPTGLPSGSTLDDTGDLMISFHWDQKQSSGIPTNTDYVTANQLNKARLRHWLSEPVGGDINPDFALAYERSPSLDSNGTTPGQITWFDHEGKAQGYELWRGTQVLPSLIARKLPDGSTWYQSFERNSWGRPTSKTETYGSGSPALTRTFTLAYAANGIDLTHIYRPGNQLAAYYAYNGRHQVLSQILYPDAQTSYTTSNTYDTYGRLTYVSHPTGLTATYTYNASSDGYPGYLSGISEQPIGRTQSFTWDNGNVYTHTDARGLTRTFTYDGLNRLVRVIYPAHDDVPSSFILYSYSLPAGMGFNTGGTSIPILHRTGVRDRKGMWTWYGRDRLGRVVSIKDPLNHETFYTYCGCGGPETITDARGKTTTFYYNNAGWKTQVTHADNTWETYGYNALGQLTSRTDALGSRTYSYNNQGLLATVQNAFGVERDIDYDIHDHAMNITDAQGVTVFQTFDRLGRFLTRAVPGQGTEGFVYSARGLTGYTGPDGELTQYAYDEAGRKTSETTPKLEIIGYGYNPAGDLLTLTDGRNKTTTWTYGLEGRVKTKKYHGQTFANLEYRYDANGWLAWRKFWLSGTSAKQTLYSYDFAGNLTLINYPSSPDISFTYNEVNQVATMTTTGLGTTTFTYTDAGNLSTESGLWTSDTVTYGYHASVPRLRTSLTIAQPTGNWSQNYFHDADRRLQILTSPAGTFTYTYLGPANVWTNLVVPTPITTAAITNAYDFAGRLSGTWLRNSAGSILNKHIYTYNAAGQRSHQTRIDNGVVAYGYDEDAQVASAVASGGQSPENLGYTYDAGWNMTQRTSGGTPTIYSVNDRNQVTADGANYHAYDINGNRTSKAWSTGSLTYTYDDENQLIGIATDTSTTPAGSRWKTEFVYDGRGRMRIRREYTWSIGSSGTEVAKASLSASASSSFAGWAPAQAIDTSSTDPGWSNSSYTGTSEYLRIDLGTVRTVNRVAYIPRVMSGNWADGSWNGVYREYEIYVTNDASGNPANWGAPVASGEWVWTNGQQRRDIDVIPTAGRYVYFRRVTGWGWYGPQDPGYAQYGYPGFACADEIWVYENGGGNWTLNSETRYIYDGLQIVQERTSSGTPLIAYSRGSDLSGSLEGAGGIGGLLARSTGYSGGNWSTHNYYHADGGGNITYLLNASQGLAASYRYDPFGRILSQSGDYANLNLFRFSSKMIHPNSGLYYYGYRWYDPNTQRWMNRDPVGEMGGINLYAFVGNSPTMFVDPYGLYTWSEWWEIAQGFGQGFGEGAAATADGLIPLFDPFETAYDPCDPLLQRSWRYGKAAQFLLTVWMGAPQGSLLGKTTLVTHWGPKGVSALHSGSWVMTGPPSFRNWVMSGSPFRYWPGNYVTATVPGGSLMLPPIERGGGLLYSIVRSVKWGIGQRIVVF